MALPSVIERMKREQEELSIAIRVWERMTEGRRTNGAMKAAAAAMALPATNGRKRHAYGWGGARPKSYVKLPETTVPEGLTLKDTPLKDAIVLALQAVKRPMDSRMLTSLLRAAGLTKSDPRGVGVTAAMLAKKKRGVKKTAKGWVAA